MSTSPFVRRGILIALGVALLDLWTKYAAFSALSNYPGSRIVVSPNFNLVMVENPGVSFGMFAGIEGGQYILSFVAGVLITVLFGWMRKSDNLSRTIALSLIVGGALGNLIDRLVNGAVADFIDLHAGGMHWPAFNLADTAIFVGVIHILWVEYRKKAS